MAIEIRAPNKLAELAAKAYLASGAERVKYIEEIRRYFQTTSCEQLDAELSQIDNANLLRMIMAAGVPACIQYRLVLQLARAGKP